MIVFLVWPWQWNPVLPNWVINHSIVFIASYFIQILTLLSTDGGNFWMWFDRSSRLGLGFMPRPCLNSWTLSKEKSYIVECLSFEWISFGGLSLGGIMLLTTVGRVNVDRSRLVYNFATEPVDWIVTMSYPQMSKVGWFLFRLLRLTPKDSLLWASTALCPMYGLLLSFCVHILCDWMLSKHCFVFHLVRGC